MPASEFDELDKAVASVLGTTPGDVSEPTAPAEPAINSETPVVEKLAEVATPVVAPRVRSRGQVMDVVPPLSSRRSIQPVSPVEPTPAPVAEEKPNDFEQPDPLDFHGFSMDETPAPKPVEEAKPAVEDEEAPVADEETPAEPLATPFLADAKVEKRPLGAFSDTPKPSDEPPKPVMPTLPIEEPKEAEPTEDEKQAALPEELHTDLLSIESVEPTPTVEEAPPVPSIVQQYKEKPSSDTKPSASIYDAEAFHTPLVHSAPKRNGWIIVVWIAALVLVGAGIGLALYFVVLPMLG